MNLHPLYKKKVLFIGRLASRSRKDAVAKLEIAGGVCRDKLTPLVDIVVLGEGAANTVGKEPNALREARDLQKTTKLLIISESEFCEML